MTRLAARPANEVDRPTHHKPQQRQGKRKPAQTTATAPGPAAARKGPANPRADCSEAEWQRFVTDCLDLGQWKWHHETDSRKSPSGYPDITAAHPEHGIIFAELKTRRGKVRPEQLAWLDVLGRAADRLPCLDVGGRQPGRVVVAVWRPEDWRRVLAVTGVSALCRDPMGGAT